MAKTPTPAQLAARERFAAMARSGAFKRKAKTKRKANPVPPKRGKGMEYFVKVEPYGWLMTTNGSRKPSRWVCTPTFSDARPFSEAAAAVIKSACDAHELRCQLAEVRAPNPLSRVKVKSPSMATGAPPTKRLTKRRKATNKAPAGYYANPVDPGLGKGSPVKQAPFTYEVQRWGASAGTWFRIAGFDYPEDATAYAKALARKEPAWRLRVVDNYGR